MRELFLIGKIFVPIFEKSACRLNFLDSPLSWKISAVPLELKKNNLNTQKKRKMSGLVKYLMVLCHFHSVSSTLLYCKQNILNRVDFNYCWRANLLIILYGRKKITSCQISKVTQRLSLEHITCRNLVPILLILFTTELKALQYCWINYEVPKEVKSLK